MRSDHTQIKRPRIAQLEAEVRAVQKQAQRQKLAQKHGQEFLALLEARSKL